MKKFTLLLALFLPIIRMEAAEESVLSTSPDGAFELVKITELIPIKDKTKEKQRETVNLILRNTKTKAEVVWAASDDEDDLIHDGGEPSLQWSPTHNRLLIISAQIYKHFGESCGVFRITDDSKLVEVSLPRNANPDRWNPDGTVVLLVKHEDVYRFDATQGKLLPVKGQKPGK